MRLGRSWRRAPGTPTFPTNSFALAPRVGPSPRALRTGTADTSFFLPSATRPSRQSEIRGFASLGAGLPFRGSSHISPGGAHPLRPLPPDRGEPMDVETNGDRGTVRRSARGGPNRRRVGADPAVPGPPAVDPSPT